MIARRAEARRDASALRFLTIVVGGWMVLRLLMQWNPAIPAAPASFDPLPPISSPFASRPMNMVLSPSAAQPLMAADIRRSEFRAILTDTAPRLAMAVPSTELSGLGVDRHAFRLAMIARLLPTAAGGSMPSALAGAGGPLWFPLAPATHAPPGQGQPFWIRRPMAGWSLTGWTYVRSGSGQTPATFGAGSQLGGSQLGLRLGYGFGKSGRTRVYGRLTAAMQRPQQRDIAIGLAYAPLAHLPVDLAVEQRIAVGREGRTALAAMVSGGVSDLPLLAGFRLDAYAQAGVVGTRRRDGFADGAVVIDHPLGEDNESPLRLGALAAGAVQPGAARVDIGPRLTLRLPDVGDGSRIAVDWRQRVAGDARPDSGLALTLASDF